MKYILSFIFSIIFSLAQNANAGAIQNADVKSKTDLQKAALITTGNVTSGNACITSLGSTSGLAVGQSVYDGTTAGNIPGFTTGTTTIAGLPGTCSAGQVQMSTTATGSGTTDAIWFGGPLSELTNTSKIWVDANNIQTDLATAITNGLIGGSGGSKNYLSSSKNGNFEQGSTTGWSLFNTTLTSGIPTGSITLTAGSVTTFGVSTTSPLAGTYSLNAASSSTWTAGQGFISNAFTIDKEDQIGKMMTITFSASVLSGASNAVFAGNSTNTFAIYIYDVTNSVWIQPQGTYALNQNSGVQSVKQVTFQTSSNGTQYQLAVMSVAASSGAVSMLFDSFTVGPAAALSGVPTTDWKSFTPVYTGLTIGTNGSSNAYWRRIGDTMEIQYAFTLGTSPTVPSTLTFSMPTGYTVDSTKIIGISNSGSSTIVGFPLVGSAFGYDNSASAPWTSTVELQNVGGSTFQVLGPTATQTGGWGTTIPFTWAIADQFQAIVRVPITGWSSNNLASSDADTRIIAMQVVQSLPTATVSSTNSLVKFTNTPNYDTHGAYSTSTGLYTVPVSGYYRVSGNVGIAATYSLTNFANISIVKNGTVIVTASQVAGAAEGAMYPTISGSVLCNAGDTLALYVATNGTAPTISSNTSNNWMTIEKFSGPATITATETVALSYQNNAGTSIANTGATDIPWPTKIYDTHGMMNTSTGVITIPVSGKYHLCAETFYSAQAYAGGERIVDNIMQNGSQIAVLGGVYFLPAATNTPVTNGCFSFSALAGDLVKTQALNNRTAGASTLSNTASNNYVVMERIGN